MFRRILLGTLITILMIAVTKYVESTPTGKEIEKFTFANLQRLFPPFSEDLPIVVVDMSKILGGKDQVTSREALKQTLTAIVAQRPSAVGIDVDFSPGVDGWQAPDDPDFFKYCLKLRDESKVPIYLGIGRTMASNSDTWLGSADYKTLAVALRAEADTMRLPKWIQAKGANDKLPLMSAALASSYLSKHENAAAKISRTIEVFTGDNDIEVGGENDVPFGMSLVNYSRLAQIQREISFTLSPAAIAESGRVFTDKMVLIGDATESSEKFNVPGHDPTVPGVFVIACAAYTLAVEPLYELNTVTRITLDLLISVFILGGVEFLRFRYVNRIAGPRFYKAQGRFLFVVIASTWVFGLILVVWLNIMWFDFPLFALAWLLHPRVEHLLVGYWDKLRSKSTSRKAPSTE
jgi:CHASE2 domain-containing sensor protein